MDSMRDMSPSYSLHVVHVLIQRMNHDGNCMDILGLALLSLRLELAPHPRIPRATYKPRARCIK